MSSSGIMAEALYWHEGFQNQDSQGNPDHLPLSKEDLQEVTVPTPSDECDRFSIFHLHHTFSTSLSLTKKYHAEPDRGISFQTSPVEAFNN